MELMHRVPRCILCMNYHIYSPKQLFDMCLLFISFRRQSESPPNWMTVSVWGRYFSQYLNIKTCSKFIVTLKQTNAQWCSTQCVSGWHWPWIFLRQPLICQISEGLSKSNHFSVAGFYCHFKGIHSWSISYPQSSSELCIYSSVLTVLYLRLRFLPLTANKIHLGSPAH